MRECTRCEIARAKFSAILRHNLGDTPDRIVDRLNDTRPGYYFTRQDKGRIVIVRSATPQQYSAKEGIDVISF